MDASVTRIEGSAFNGCYDLTNVIIGSSVVDIGDFAFYGSGLQSVTVGPSVSQINYLTFSNCYNLRHVILGVSVTLIDREAFTNSAVQSVVGSSVITVEDYAFEDCAELETVAVGSSLQYIGESAFYNCNQLRNLSTLDFVAYIGGAAFEGCSSLPEFSLSALKQIHYSTFSGTGIEGVLLPSVESISEWAFLYCVHLKRILIPSTNLTFVANTAFAGTCASSSSIVYVSDAVDPNVYRNKFFRCTVLALPPSEFPTTLSLEVPYTPACSTPGMFYSADNGGTCVVCPAGRFANATGCHVCPGQCQCRCQCL